MSLSLILRERSGAPGLLSFFDFLRGCELWKVTKANLGSDRAFSQVVKDNQYSALGLMLLGTLARIQKALQVLSDRREDEELWEEESMMVVVDVGDENKVDGKEEMEGVDFGEKILREEVVTHGGEEGDGEAVEVQKLSKGKEKRKSELAGAEVGKNGGESTPTKKPKKKKRKKGGDVFDDLFDSLM